jgi:hypothetical protein
MVETSDVVELIIYSVDTHKVGHIGCYRQNIGILTSEADPYIHDMDTFAIYLSIPQNKKWRENYM